MCDKRNILSVILEGFKCHAREDQRLVLFVDELTADTSYKPLKIQAYRSEYRDDIEILENALARCKIKGNMTVRDAGDSININITDKALYVRTNSQYKNIYIWNHCYEYARNYMENMMCRHQRRYGMNLKVFWKIINLYCKDTHNERG